MTQLPVRFDTEPFRVKGLNGTPRDRL
eukprot:SAG31_NODE_17828_length_656_cov_1.263914_1_plen_26_part_10